jgi:hypothetical protein
MGWAKEPGSGAGDAPWSGREAPARSAPFGHLPGGSTGSGSLREPPPGASFSPLAAQADDVVPARRGSMNDRPWISQPLTIWAASGRRA